MAHELDFSNARANMAFVGATPWHQLGEQLQPDAPMDVWLRAAGMEHTIQAESMFYTHGEDVLAVPDRVVLKRSDTGAALGVVGAGYKVVQPAEVLGFFQALTEEAGFQLHTAGCLFGGKRMWALAKVGEDALVGKADTIGGYLLLSTACDGTMATSARFTTVRVVCNNTLSMAVAAGGAEAVRVTHRSVLVPEQVHAQLGIATAHFATFVDAAKELTRIKLTETKAATFVGQLLLPTLAPTATLEQAMTGPGFASIMALFNGAGRGADLKTSANTAWGLVNAVTQHVDHHARATTTDNRLTSAWYGDGDKLKTAAFQSALLLAA